MKNNKLQSIDIEEFLPTVTHIYGKTDGEHGTDLEVWYGLTTALFGKEMLFRANLEDDAYPGAEYQGETFNVIISSDPAIFGKMSKVYLK
jgi:hypothetical protein